MFLIEGSYTHIETAVFHSCVVYFHLFSPHNSKEQDNFSTHFIVFLGQWTSHYETIPFSLSLIQYVWLMYVVIFLLISESSVWFFPPFSFPPSIHRSSLLVSF